MLNHDSQIHASFLKPTPYWLLAGFWACTAIAIAVVIRRLAVLAHPSTSGPSPIVALDRTFLSHTALTLAHIIPALGFVLVAPFALLRRFAAVRWPNKLLYPLGIIVGVTAYAMSAFAVGGWNERLAVIFFDTLFLYSLVRAWRYQLQDHYNLGRQWLMRAIAVLLGIATTRPVMGVFFATRHATHLSLQQFFGIAFWIGFSINWIVAEVWLHFGNRQIKP
ncbi:MAG: DUF2306 domain-containing protein [Terracidiphilus sp.]